MATVGGLFIMSNRMRAVFSCEKEDYMERILFLLFILYSLFVASPMPAAAESQTWKVRLGDNLDIKKRIENEKKKKNSLHIILFLAAKDCARAIGHNKQASDCRHFLTSVQA